MKNIAGMILYLFVVMGLMEVTFSHPLIGALIFCAVAGGISVRH